MTAVFTPISLDHTRQLGATVEEIARTKSGIIKPGATVVTAAQPDGALAAIVSRASAVGARVLVAGADFGGAPLSRSTEGQEITLRRIGGETIPRTRLKLHGDHQAANAALAVAAVDAFLETFPHEPAMNDSAVCDALFAASSPGRLQVIGREPLVILDAAHNPAGAVSLAAALREWPGVTQIAFVLGVLEEKDAEGIVAALHAVASCFFVTQSESPRAIGHGRLSRLVAEVAGGANNGVRDFEDPAAALSAACAWAASRPGSAVVVTGSITLIGDTLNRARHAAPEPL